MNIFLRALRAAFTSWQCATEGILVYSLFQRENNGKCPASADVKGFMLFFFFSLISHRSDGAKPDIVKPLSVDAATSVCPAVLFYLLESFSSEKKKQKNGDVKLKNIQFGHAAPLLLFCCFSNLQLKWSRLNKSCPRSFSDITLIAQNK